MKRRLIVALIALAGLTAFAPAPLPRVQRRGDPDSVSLQQVQGEWKVVSFDTIGPNNQRSDVRWFQGVSIKGEQLTYLNNGMEAHSPFRIAIDGGKRPATIDFMHGSTTSAIMIGIVRRQGNRFTILYYSAGHQRPTSFENIPVGWWLLVLERQ